MYITSSVPCINPVTDWRADTRRNGMSDTKQHALDVARLERIEYQLSNSDQSYDYQLL